MAELNARTDTFIALLLNVSGRARSTDLPDMPPDAALALLQAYKQAHPETPTFFDGDALVFGLPASSAPPTAPPAAYGVPAAVETQPAPAPTAEFGAPAADPYAAPEAPALPTEELPSWYFEQGSEAPGASPDTTAPETPYAVPPSDTMSQAADAVAGESDYVDLPAAEFAMPGGKNQSSQLEWWWWAVAILFMPIGTLIAWFVNRERSPKAARVFLIISIVWLVSILAVVAVVVLGGAAVISGIPK